MSGTKTTLKPRIERGIPIPISVRNPLPVDVMMRMKVGDSILRHKKIYGCQGKNFATTIKSWARRNHVKMVGRSEKLGYRIWRVQ